ncbi:MAG: malto-oligosyltrehalose trehalohydrolase [Steroidobacteraceae bacterium]
MSLRSRHEMPFGAQLVEGGVRFRLWAPGAKSVAVMLPERSRPHTLDMTGQPGGWYELVTREAHADSRYRFTIDDVTAVPDPAARAYHAAEATSLVVDALDYDWHDEAWRGRPWHEAVIYELHVGTFTPQGTFAGVESRLEHLVELGVTAIELMPIAAFPGNRGWGYDGVLAFAPQGSYGTPAQLKSLIDAAHQRGLAVMLDVVYNHFGPEGNWLHAYAPQFFTPRHRTPWGDAINFDGEHSRTVRDFFIHNALYWLEEYHFDGLRVDAVHAMADEGRIHFIRELSRRVHSGPGRLREVYLVLENYANTSGFLGNPRGDDVADAQWNDDVHHCLHVILTGETDGYYRDYARDPYALLCRCLAEGFGYQGEASQHKGGQPRGEPSGHLPPTAFVNFLQNHDQIGNRARGERLHALVKDEAALLAATAIVLLAPSPPLLFMGDEWSAPEPFTYFCDFEPGLAQKVREGRKREFAKFAHFADGGRQPLPDPTSAATFTAARLNWRTLAQPGHAEWLGRYRLLLAIRKRDIMPLVPGIRASGTCTRLSDGRAFEVHWRTDDGTILRLIANLSDTPASIASTPAGQVIYTTHPNAGPGEQHQALEPWSVTWRLERPHG